MELLIPLIDSMSNRDLTCEGLMWALCIANNNPRAIIDPGLYTKDIVSMYMPGNINDQRLAAARDINRVSAVHGGRGGPSH